MYITYDQAEELKNFNETIDGVQYTVNYIDDNNKIKFTSFSIKGGDVKNYEAKITDFVKHFKKYLVEKY